MRPGSPLPPGTILQRMHLRRRLRQLPPGRFVEVGTGEGYLSQLLLALGWSGEGWDLNEAALARSRELNAGAIEDGRYAARQGDWLAEEPDGDVDLVVSAMVLEHLDDRDEERFFHQARRALRPDGRLVLLVPASPAHWGIEDEVAGHIRRYTRERLASAAARCGWEVSRVDGLTWPVSNLLLSISNRRVARFESARLADGLQERTIGSGSRQVPWKTTFPPFTRLVLNEVALAPFDLVQRLGRGRPDCLVLYAELALVPA
jgi:SAM-dependent methyltransferase